MVFLPFRFSKWKIVIQLFWHMTTCTSAHSSDRHILYLSLPLFLALLGKEELVKSRRWELEVLTAREGEVTGWTIEFVNNRAYFHLFGLFSSLLGLFKVFHWLNKSLPPQSLESGNWSIISKAFTGSRPHLHILW